MAPGRQPLKAVRQTHPWARGMGAVERSPGWALVVVGAIAALLAAALVPTAFGAALMAVLLGWVVGGRGLPVFARAGVSSATKWSLLLGVVMLGFTIDLGVLRAAGPTTLGLALTAVAAALASAVLTARLVGLRGRLGWMLGIGTGICGVSAMVASQRAIGAKERDVVQATVMITVIGSIGMVALPALSIHRGIEALPAGQWMGATLHAVPQALGAGLAAGGLAGAEAAALVKLTRVAMLPLLVIVASWLASGRGRPVLPPEVLGFAATLLIGNALPWPVASLEAVAAVARVALIAGLFGMAAQMSWKGLALGWRPWIVAAASWGTVVVATLLLLH